MAHFRRQTAAGLGMGNETELGLGQVLAVRLFAGLFVQHWAETQGRNMPTLTLLFLLPANLRSYGPQRLGSDLELFTGKDHVRCNGCRSVGEIGILVRPLIQSLNDCLERWLSFTNEREV